MDWAVERLEVLVSERDDDIEDAIEFFEGKIEDLSKIVDWSSLIDLTDKAFWRVTSSKADHSVSSMLNKPLDIDLSNRKLSLEDSTLMETLRSSGTDFWQSDGSLPHSIWAEWPHQTAILEYALIWIDKSTDESYTPKEIAIKALAGYDTWVEVNYLEFGSPTGWILLPLSSLRTKGFCIQILANYQDGRDTRLRLLRLYGKIL